MGFKSWCYKHAPRWNKMFAAALAVYFASEVIKKVAPENGAFSGEMWLTIGVVIGGLITWVTAPDASKSELSEYVHAELEAETEK